MSSSANINNKMTYDDKLDYFFLILFVLFGMLTFYLPFFLVGLPDIKLLLNRIPVDIQIYTKAQDGQTKLWSCDMYIDLDIHTWASTHDGLVSTQITSVHDNWSSTGIELNVLPSTYCTDTTIWYIPNENKYFNACKDNNQCSDGGFFTTSSRIVMSDDGKRLGAIFIVGGLFGINILGPIVGTIILICMLYQYCRGYWSHRCDVTFSSKVDNDKTLIHSLLHRAMGDKVV